MPMRKLYSLSNTVDAADVYINVMVDMRLKVQLLNQQQTQCT